tara:strand:+ start:1463 stop:2587 length:1125 start_codon:yes stop_codon:yes gene_type:complete
MEIQTPVVILLFFIILFFIYHIYYTYKPQYEGFTSLRGGFLEGFQGNLKMKKKNKLTNIEKTDRDLNELPKYGYKEDVPLDEKKKEPNNSIVHGAKNVNYEKESITDTIEKKLDNSDFIFNKGNDIWTKFYCSIYDSLMLDNTKNNYELKEIVRNTKMDKKSHILDIGCGTGHHVNMLTKKGLDAIGIDSSIEMIKRAKKNFPKCKFYNSDVMHGNQFGNGEFTHCMMLFMTPYYIQDKKAAFHNVYSWLKPNGYMIIHLVNRDKFDPRIEASDPLYKVNPQRFAKERITKSFVKFNDFQYKGEFVENGDSSKYVETMKQDNGNKAIRNEHNYHMESQKEIIQKARDVGFKLKGKINMSPCQYPYEYLYVFEKV